MINNNQELNILAVISLIIALLGLLTSWFLPLVAQIISIICGHTARLQIRESNGSQKGDGFALAGLIISYVEISVALLIITLILS